MSTLTKKIYHSSSDDKECIIIGGAGGVQICTGKVNITRPASVALNGSSSIYFRRRRIKGTNSMHVGGIGHIDWTKA